MKLPVKQFLSLLVAFSFLGSNILLTKPVLFLAGITDIQLEGRCKFCAGAMLLCYSNLTDISVLIFRR